jgi:hypothetical protein
VSEDHRLPKPTNFTTRDVKFQTRTSLGFRTLRSCAHAAELFRAADTDNIGTLDRSEFAAVLKHQRLGLSDRMIDRMLAETDDNDDGVIQYACASTSFPVVYWMDSPACSPNARQPCSMLNNREIATEDVPVVTHQTEP